MTSRNQRAQLMRVAVSSIGVVLLIGAIVWSIQDHLARRDTTTLLASISASNVVSLTNIERQGDNLPVLRTSDLLTQAAQLKAEHMADNEYYAHVSPDGKTPLYWLDRVGYKYLNAGENLVIDRTTAEQAVSAWMHSKDHRANILRPQFTEIGVGVADGRYKGEDTIFVVQVFATPYPSVPAVREPEPAPKPVVPVTRTVVTAPAPVATPSEILKKPEPIPAPVLAPVVKPVPVTPVKPNTLISQVQTLTQPVLEALTPMSAGKASTSSSTVSTVATSTYQYSESGLQLPEPIELFGTEVAQEESVPWHQSLMQYLQAIPERMKTLWSAS